MIAKVRSYKILLTQFAALLQSSVNKTSFTLSALGNIATAAADVHCWRIS